MTDRHKNIFDIHKDILDDYKLYIDSFINIADKRILETVRAEFESGKLYPDPLIQFNPSFESGGKVEDLVKEGVLVDDLNHIFYDESGKSWSIYKHQAEAIKKGNEGKGFVVTSGTGSGKSLTYISAIFNYLFKHPNNKGIKAIIVYPLNALINSQESALNFFAENYKKRTGKDLPFKFAKYTGQESQATRDALKNSPPDILLTNYMMLELLMVRKDDADLRQSFLDNLHFLVYDELHVYKGRQGADVSLLNRRIKGFLKNKDIICIGTSATITSGTIEEQKQIVAKVASNFFDVRFSPENIIIESLAYSTREREPQHEELKKSVTDTISKGSKDKLLNHPLAIWLERTIAIKQDGTNKLRNEPLSLIAVAKILSNQTGVNEKLCEAQIVELLTWAEAVNVESTKEKNKETVLPFKLHQFISQTGYVYVTLEDPTNRYVTLDPSPSVKLKDNESDVPVFQIVFSRVSGQEFICVRKEGSRFIPRDFNDDQNPKNDDDLKLNDGKRRTKKQRSPEEYTDGYILIGKGEDQIIDIEDYVDLLPPAWLTKSGQILAQKEIHLPKEIYVAKDGSFSEIPIGGIKAYFITTPLIYDPTCGMIYLETKLSEKSKLISIGNEGRSTSTTLLTLQTLLALHKNNKPIAEQKLLSFTDNRQDASLQSGHFNDFVQVVHLRSAIEKVLRNSDVSFDIHRLVYKVQDTLHLDESEYAYSPSTNPQIPSEKNRKALRNYLTYRIILDLKRGWRYILPNLEQTALLFIDYEDLEKYCQDESLWQNIELLTTSNFEFRHNFVLQVLNYFRSQYAIDYEILRYENRLLIQDELHNTLNKEKLWSLDDGEKIEAPNFLSLQGAAKASREIFLQSIGVRSRLGRYIKHEFRKHGNIKLSTEDYDRFMTDLLKLLTDLHYLKQFTVHAESGDKIAYQLILSSVQWIKGDKSTVISDKTANITLDNEVINKPHYYFQKIYQEDFTNLPKSYIAAEHTGQISNEEKIDREKKFNEAKDLSALYCSPTMELGIDISSLNIVHMRNVPPSPANYAQRSGRAGRSGQSALVFTYASKISPHDKHYFTDPVKMVSGIVQSPRIDITNESLIQSHINATVLSILNAEEFKPSLESLIDFSGRTYRLIPDLKKKYQDIINNRYPEILGLVHEIIWNIPLSETTWFTDKWLENQIREVPDKLDSALERWSKMYLDAVRQLNEAHEIKLSPLIKDKETKKIADRSYWLAENRLKLLLNNSNSGKNSSFSEFYTFRYLASEGFLPGYNFTRLPIRVFLGSKDLNTAISRPRFIGLREFGPNNLVYHNGAKFKINRVTPNDVSLELSEIKISKDTSYAFLDREGIGKNQDPITGKVFDASDLETHTNLLELHEAQTVKMERISCMEEIRKVEGYQTSIFLNTPDGLINATKIKLTIDEQELMKLFFAPSAKLIMLNKKWRRAVEEGFDIGTKSGLFKTKKEIEKANPEDPIANVMLFTYDTSDILYIQPVKSLNLNEEGVVTLQYALTKAIEMYYNIEPVEISARLMGINENKNIMLYESSEGSIGVLKDIARNPAKLHELWLLAYQICGYSYETKEDKYPSRPRASYDDLLSYYNQIDHQKINRHSAIAALELLISSQPDNTEGTTYEGKYRELFKNIHQSSPGEKQLLDFLFENGYQLPDFTNYNLEKYYIQPDFVYKDEKALIFVDGGIHKNAVVKADDAKKRITLKNDGFDVLVWDQTSEPVSAFVTRRQDIFRKVR